MHHAAHLVRLLFSEDAQRVLGGLSGVNDERLAQGSGRPNVNAKALALPVQIALEPKVIQPGLSNGCNLGVCTTAHQFLHRGLLAHRLVVRVHTHRGHQMVVRANHAHHLIGLLQGGADVQSPSHARLGHALQDLIRALSQPLIVQVAVRVGKGQLSVGWRRRFGAQWRSRIHQKQSP